MSAASEWGRRIASDTIFETLLRFTPPATDGASPAYRPGLATRWEVLGNGQLIRLELADNVAFHDGRRLSAVDVQFSLDAARHPRRGPLQVRRQLADVVGVDILGPRRVRIRLRRPSAQVLRALAEVAIVPAHVYRDRSPTSGAVGSGPYRLESFEPDLVTLVRNEAYWGSAPAIERIEFLHQPDAAAALTAAKRGELDLIGGLIAAHYPEQASAPALARSFAPLRLRPATLRYLAVNHGRAPFADVRVRRALALLIDRGELVRGAHGGLARAVSGPIWLGGPGHGRAPPPPSHAPQEAARLLDAAGLRDTDGDGIRELEGRRWLVDVLVSEEPDAGRELVLESLRRAGILTSVRTASAAVILNRLESGDFDLAFVEWRGDVDRGVGELVGIGGALNFGRFGDAQVEELLGALESVWQPAKRAPLMAQLALELARALPIVPLIAPDPYGLVHHRVRGVKPWNGWLSLRELSLDPHPSPE